MTATDKQPNKTYIIQHKETKEMFIARSGKSSWKQPGHAKNAWNQSFYSARQVEAVGMQMITDPSSYSPERKRVPLFSEQDVFEVVELKHEAHSKLDEAIAILKSALGRCEYKIHNEITEFLKGVE